MSTPVLSVCPITVSSWVLQFPSGQVALYEVIQTPNQTNMNRIWFLFAHMAKTNISTIHSLVFVWFCASSYFFFLLCVFSALCLFFNIVLKGVFWHLPQRKCAVWALVKLQWMHTSTVPLNLMKLHQIAHTRRYRFPKCVWFSSSRSINYFLKNQQKCQKIANLKRKKNVLDLLGCNKCHSSFVTVPFWCWIRLWIRYLWTTCVWASLYSPCV